MQEENNYILSQFLEALFNFLLYVFLTRQKL